MAVGSAVAWVDGRFIFVALVAAGVTNRLPEQTYERPDAGDPVVTLDVA